MSGEKVKKKLKKNVSDKTWNLNKQTLLIGVSIIISIALFYLNSNYKIELTQRSYNSSSDVFSPNAPKYCVHIEDTKYLYILSSVEKVINFLGLEKVEFLNGSELNKNCNFFWIYNYPFKFNFTFKNMEYHQRLNHIPGNYALVSKSVLGTTSNSKYIPKAFTNSRDLQKYAEKNPEKRFVQKLKGNRGVHLKKASEMNFTVSATNDQYFGQEFVENPLLFDGHKFDFGVYVVITSVNPLRFYYYSDNCIIRLCSRPYDPNNFDDLKTYVINDEHVTGVAFKNIREYYDKSYSYKHAMNAYFTEKGYNMSKAWNQVEDCIRSTIVSRNDYFLKAVSGFDEF